MVYPRRDASRSLVKFVTLCAVASCLFQGTVVANIYRKQAPSMATTCQALSDDEAAAGILIVQDSSCAEGGVGCIDTVCRFCTTGNTTESSDFLECSKLGWTPDPATTDPTGTVATSTPEPVVATLESPAPTSALVVTDPDVEVDTGCPYDVSPGDFHVGIQLVGDATCVNGGQGCFEDVCRFCQFRTTQQSKHLWECGRLGFNFSTPGSDIGSDDAPAPALGPGNQDVDSGCPYAVSDGDAAVGIQLVGDATCVVGGLGCFADVCRFCKYQNTTQSSHLVECKDLGVDFGAQPTTSPKPVPATTTAAATSVPGTSAPSVNTTTSVSDGNATTLIPVATTSTPASGTLPATVTTTTPAPASATTPVTEPASTVAATTSAPASGTPPASVTTTAPTPATATTPAAEPATTPTPEPQVPTIPVVDPSTGCPYPVSEGDFAVGIQLVGDATCAVGGLGCFKDVCRFCKFQETEQSSQFVDCADFGYPDTEEPTFAPVDIDDTTNPTAGPTVAPSVSPMPTMAPTAGPTVAPTAGPSTRCAYPVTEGDFNVGIQLVGDASCASGGLGCYKGVCRYCQFRPTAQSGHLELCKDLGYDFAGGSDASDPKTNTPVTTTPVLPPVDTKTGCPYPVTEGDLAVGIQLVGDPTCGVGGLGCFKNVCRYCKFLETAQSGHLLDCGDFGYPQTEAPTFAPVDILEPEPTDDAGSNGDSDIPAETPIPDIYDGSNDYEVPLPTPIDDTVAPPADDTHTPPADDTAAPPADDTSAPIATLEPPVDDTPEPPSDDTPEPVYDTPAPSADEMPNYGTGCPYPVSEDAFNDGIQLVGDASCVDGGVGCFNEVCRFCQFRNTPNSGYLMTCTGLGYDLGSGSDASEPPVVPPPTDDSATPHVDDTDAPPADDTSAPPVDYTIAPPVDNTNAPPADNTAVPAADDTPVHTATSEPPVDDTSEPPVDNTPEPVYDTPTPPTDDLPNYGTGCPYPVSEDAFNDGIQLVGDASCIDGGLGCFNDVCRFCQFRNTPNSGYLMTCTGLGYDLGSGSDASEPPVVAPPTDDTVSPPTDNDPMPPADDTPAPLVDDTITPPVNNTDAPPADHPPVPPTVDTPAPSGVDTPSPPGGTVPPVYDTPEPPINELPNHGTGCPYPVSEGDLGVGIQLVGDASCVDGGLGCVDGICRFCRFRTTPNSKHLMSCMDLGYDIGSGSDASEPTTDTPVTTTPVLPPVDTKTGCPYPVTEGDLAVGIQLVGDPTCGVGGLGCFKNMCRYCKFLETAQSGHLLDCGDFGYPQTEAPTFAPVDIDDPTVNPAVTPTVDPVADPTVSPRVDPTVAPTVAPTVSPTVGPSTGCAYPVTEGNFNVGIQLVGDASCATGGLGCFGNVCRYCQFRRTAQSGHLKSCKDLGYDFAAGSNVSEPTTNGSNASEPTTNAPATTDAGIPTNCPLSVSEGDAAVGIQLLTDLSCVKGGVGCVADVCRFCKFRDTPQSTHLVDCASYLNSTPASSDGIPISQPSAVNATTCPFTASEGDLYIGVQIIEDTTCDIDGNGCFHDACRFCKFFDTDKSSHLDDCSDFGFHFEPIATTAAPHPGGTTASPPGTTAPTTTTTTASPTTTLPPTVNPSGICNQTVSKGDKDVGINMVTDVSCPGVGVGCVANSVCRFCKVRETAQNAHMEWCLKITGIAGETLAPASHGASQPATVTGTSPATATATSPPPATPRPGSVAPCNQTVSDGDKHVGIDLITDGACVDGGVGCLPDTTCRLCKLWATNSSAHLYWCGAYDGYVPPPPPPTIAGDPPSTPAPTLNRTTCSTEVSPGDAEAGVAAVHDEQCVNGGIGCFGGVCRFCQVFRSNQSAHLLPCASMVSTIAPLRAAARVRAASSESTSFQHELDKLFKDKTFKWSVVGAACFGVVAVVALFGHGAKRAIRRSRRRPSSVEAPSVETEGEADAAAVSAIAASPSSSESEDDAAEEVHV